MKNLSQLAHLGPYENAVEEALEELHEQNIVTRIWERDHTIWRDEPDQIANRLGWLDIAERVREDVGRLEELRRTLLAEGYTDVLHMGMGGSSLAPDVFSRVFGDEEPGLRLHVLDSTDPGAVLDYVRELDPAHTLYIVATKSGTTVETLSFFKYFYNRALEALGEDEAGGHFVAITDPGSKLAALGERLGFREIFLNDPNIGGRYSALSYFGMVPAALVGVDVARLLERAQAMMEACGPRVPPAQNPGVWLGAVMGALANEEVDKLTLVAAPEFAPFGDWVEQLIAESTGKSETGILPVVGEPLVQADDYRPDRLFVHLGLPGDTAYEAQLSALAGAGFPVVHLPVDDLYDMGGLFFLWELATAVAGERLEIQPFNQPNVESAKQRAKEMVRAYHEQGELPPAEYAELQPESLTDFLAQARPPADEHPCGPEDVGGDYIALQAFVEPTPETEAALQKLRTRLLLRYNVATTLGYGPRYLHSTGQLHKGDAGHGLFVQLVSDAPEDAPIPDETDETGSSITFDVLKQAQAQGDYRALLDAGRRIIRFHVGTDVVDAIQTLTESL
jgi:glucose-6-phosphate isomerase